MFDAEDVLGIYNMGATTKLENLGTHAASGKLLGLTFLWQATMQPSKVEWLAPVVFFSADPKELYIACDAVHGNLMSLVIQDSQGGDTYLDLFSDTDRLEQAEEALTNLRQIAICNDRRVTTASTLRVKYTMVGASPTLSYFYTLECGQISQLLLEAAKCDPQVQVVYIDNDLPSTGKYRDFFTAGRNAPCNCGSGKKFKKCHGIPQ